jgi:phosphatidyl-myo-inositol dimannoside synthase
LTSGSLIFFVLHGQSLEGHHAGPYEDTLRLDWGPARSSLVIRSMSVIHTDMAKAVLVTSSFLPGRGGIESYLAGLCSALRPDLAVLAPSARDGRPLPRDLGYPTTGMPAPFLVPGPPTLAAILRALDEHRADRVLFGTPWPLALLGPSLHRRGVPYGVIVHAAETFVPAALPGLRRAMEKALGDADLLLAVSHYTADRVRALLAGRGLAPPPIEVLRAKVDLRRWHPGVDTAPVSAMLGLDGRKMVLTFGRLTPRKGVHRLIHAWPSVARRAPQALLVIAGRGPQEPRLRRLAHREGVPAVFAGAIPERHAPAFHAAASLFALPVVDRWAGLEVEGLGVALLEAGACGVPAVTGRSGGTPEAVVDGDTGYVVDARDRDALADRVVELLHDEALARRMGEAARRHVARSFSDRPPPQRLTDWLG